MHSVIASMIMNAIMSMEYVPQNLVLQGGSIIIVVQVKEIIYSFIVVILKSP